MHEGTVKIRKAVLEPGNFTRRLTPNVPGYDVFIYCLLVWHLLLEQNDFLCLCHLSWISSTTTHPSRSKQHLSLQCQHPCYSSDHPLFCDVCICIKCQSTHTFQIHSNLLIAIVMTIVISHSHHGMTSVWKQDTTTQTRGRLNILK